MRNSDIEIMDKSVMEELENSASIRSSRKFDTIVITTLTIAVTGTILALHVLN